MNRSRDESGMNLKLYKHHLVLGTALHVAVMTKRSNEFVKNLVELMPREKLALKDADGDTALHCAAAAGNIQAAKALVGNNPDFPYIPNKKNQLPVLRAALTRNRQLLDYLILHRPKTRNATSSLSKGDRASMYCVKSSTILSC